MSLLSPTGYVVPSGQVHSPPQPPTEVRFVLYLLLPLAPAILSIQNRMLITHEMTLPLTIRRGHNSKLASLSNTLERGTCSALALHKASCPLPSPFLALPRVAPITSKGSTAIHVVRNSVGQPIGACTHTAPRSQHWGARVRSVRQILCHVVPVGVTPNETYQINHLTVNKTHRHVRISSHPGGT